MLPIDFPGRNRILTGPKDEKGEPATDLNILDLPVFSNERVCVSLWQLDESERAELRDTGSLWIWLCASVDYPVYVSAVCPIRDNGVFVEPQPFEVNYQNEQHRLMCWVLEQEEIDLIEATGRFWFTIQSGRTQSPIWFQVPTLENWQAAQA